MRVRVCGCDALILGVRGWREGVGFMYCFFLLDLPEIFPTLVFWCSFVAFCPSPSIMVVPWVVMLKSSNLALRAHCPRDVFVHETNFLFFFLCFLIFSSMLDEK